MYSRYSAPSTAGTVDTVHQVQQGAVDTVDTASGHGGGTVEIQVVGIQWNTARYSEIQHGVSWCI